jgi:predicted GTPase
VAALTSIIREQLSVEALIRRSGRFDFLAGQLPASETASCWKRDNVVTEDLQVIALGKSGYGKSTTLNQLVGRQVFETSDIEGCTRVMQSAEYRFAHAEAAHYFSLADLPGLGERPALDREYIALYQDALEMAHAVLYFLRADQRDYAIDEWAFSQLFADVHSRKKVIIVLNAIDKAEPLHRNFPFALSAEQSATIGSKVASIARQFKVTQASIIPISAQENIDLDRLIARLAKVLKPSMQAA